MPQNRNSKKRKRPAGEKSYDAIAPFISTGSSPPPSHTNPAHDDDDDEAQWQTVKSKKQKKRERYPSISYSELHRLQSYVRLGDLQSLMLYCLAVGPAPQFVALQNQREIERVVVLLVPGLERAMFERGFDVDVDATASLTSVQDAKSMVTGSLAEVVNEVRNNAQSNRVLDYHGPSPDDFLPTKLPISGSPSVLKPLAEIFEYVWPIKSPGEDFQVHSPLHAMLQAPVPKTRAEKEFDKRHKGAKPIRGSDQWDNKRTSITEYMLAVEDLVDNDFVLSPLCYGQAGIEREKEEAKRKIQGRTEEDGWVDVKMLGTHRGKTEDVLGALNGSVDMKKRDHDLTGGRQVFAIDCEMCIVQGGASALTRISIVDWSSSQVLDEYVRPEEPIIDYLTPYSGITPMHMATAKMTLKDIQTRLQELLTPDTILIGHSLESDLAAMKITYPYIVDTSVLYPHPRGPPMKSSLKWLCQKYLTREIQKGHGTTGHSSVEDARAVLDLVKQKCERGPAWGTWQAAHEPVFKRLKRVASNGAAIQADGRGVRERQGCIIDWGDPGSHYGKMADHAIGCQNDEEVVEAVNRAVNGDEDGSAIPAKGVSLTWARMRGLETARAFRDDVPSAPTSNGSTEIDTTAPIIKLSAALDETLSHITAIHDSLPPRTLFIVYSGTGDPRPLRQLSQRKKRYHRLMKEGVSWDDNPDKWTDGDDQALKAAVMKARLGVGFVGISREHRVESQGVAKVETQEPVEGDGKVED